MSLDFIFAAGSAVFATALAWIGFGRAPRHPSQLWFALGLLIVAAEVALGLFPVPTADPLAWQRRELREFSVAALVMAPWILFSVSYSRGDYATSVKRPWWILVGLSVALSGVVWLWPTGVVATRDLVTGRLQRVGVVGFAIELFNLLGSVLVLTNLERTYRHAVGVMRWRIKYVILGVGVLFVFRLFMASQGLLYGVVDPRIQQVAGPVLILACGLMSIALRRTQAFTVDVYPSHTFLFRSLTILLAGVYLLIVGVLARLVTFLGGDSALPLKALLVLLALTVLAVGIMSDRVRQRLQRFVSRHLRRPTYDYQRVWSTFTARTTSLVDEPEYCRGVVTWVSETFEVLSVSLWLLDETRERLRFGGSTSLAESVARELEESAVTATDLLSQLGQQRSPINLDDPDLAWAGALRQLHPGVFPHGGDRTCLSLMAGGELQGVLVVGDRVSGLPLTDEDLELLQCVGDQVGAGLLNLQLSRRLVRAKEMEAFQTMSAFFVHDLKNTASSLSLMLQNLEEHFADPEFRADAVRAVGKSVQHLNDLIGRLGQLRKELKLQPEPADFTEVVESALAGTGRPPHLSWEKELQPLPTLRLDPAQIRSVIQNLVLNAQDAAPASGGTVRLVTRRVNDWAVLEVIDNGSGMTPEFLRRSLFRPFQTTKKRGLGIGMFQSKMIVEAHRGRIEVESAPGQGTTVRVLLPVVDRS
ncbi:MAG: PEP-CTERM system histidine kinase PrsK [Verrucomicrobia bacterium]|nr:PEP-CTERM system histidine kinase PrsK [Verrucomicrobiota bacterium]